MQPGFGQTELDGVGRKPMVVLSPREPLLLSDGDDVTIDDDRGGRVVIEGGEPKDRRHGRSVLLASTVWPKTSGYAASRVSATTRWPWAVK